MTDDEPTRLLRGLLAVVTDLDALPHAGPVGRVMLAAAVAGRGCSDDAFALAASMSGEAVREVIPTMLDRCLHVPALLTAKVNRHPLGITYSGIRLPGEATRRLRKARDDLTRA
ncbi:hypothetical protein [Lichenibacterium ramalinae]|uniref:Uncharacterized protein n=1 Tax=Lichenibacterium ramalinae TaxID=2316527 RepID=A0A4Q2R7B6_9HYPH|nr:hypothetical protein [Lichenibacterium ramalinae]RYB01374.1 hypothetical protein D3272_26435 [Lichenibacterium ramalinae]